MAENQAKRDDEKYIPMRPQGRSGGFRGGIHGAPAEKPKNLKGTLRRLWHYFDHEKKLFSIIFTFLIIDSLIVLSTPYLTGRAIDFLSGGRGKVQFAPLKTIIILLLIVYLCDILLNFLNNFLMAGVSQRIVKRLRATLFNKLQSLPIAFFDKKSHGDLMSRFTNDIDNISSTISQSTVTLMSDCIAIVGSFAIMIWLNPLLTLASVITVPLITLLSRTIAGRTRKLFKAQQAALGRLNGQIEETISGLNVVKAFNHEQIVIEEFEKTNQELFSVGLKAQITSGYLMPLMNIISNLGFAMVAGFGGVLAVRGMITIGVITSFLIYSKQFSRPLNDIANIFNTLQTAVAGAERIFEIIDTEGEPKDNENAEELIFPKGEVKFENVTFEYRPGVPILKDITFTVNAGSTIALVGPTGAGKTTVVNLLNRFYDVTNGQILLDNKDIRSYSRSSLRSCFGIVLQDTYLFSGTISDNICYGNLEATDEEIQNAAIMANADSFIRKLEHGYKTELSESGSNLSQGQRQLLALARAILANPSILILDEATSSVDTRTEMNLQEAMVTLMNGRTCFIIAHRLSTIRDADIIMVIDDGHIVESGSHESLLEQRGFYYNLYNCQFNNIST